ncbi:MAG TPA: CopD family protein [Noviherbaspirillum sp.]|nr:CopD family protein [Noviherbaspirillum sp.]
MIAAKFLHILGFTVWVGGMFFAYMALRPVAATRLAPEQRLPLWEGVFGKFFPWVWLSVALILASGLYMMAQIGKPPVSVATMFVSGVVMMLIFAHLFFAPYKRLKRAVAAQDWKAGGAALGQIRMLVGINLILGLMTVTIGALGPALVLLAE